MELVKLMKNLANYCNLPNLSKFLLPMFFIVQYIDASTPNIIINCDQACENRAYLDIKFGTLTFSLNTAMPLKLFD